MKKYLITIKVGLETYKEIVEAKNLDDAREQAARIAYKKSNYGNGAFLQSFSAKLMKPITSNKNKERNNGNLD